MSKVFFLKHVRIDGDEENIKDIGIYENEDLAKTAIKTLIEQEGFSEYPDGFHIDKYELNFTFWSDGFVK